MEGAVRASDWGQELKTVVAIFTPAIIILTLLLIAALQ